MNRSYLILSADGKTLLGIDESMRYEIESITIPSSVICIGDEAFSDCYMLSSVIIPNSVTTIGDGAFSNCALISIVIPNSVKTIGERAFEHNDLTSIIIPKSVTSIGKEVFFNCSSLTTIVVEDGNPIYDSRKNCNAIIETATNTLIAGCKNTIIRNTITSIGESAFYFCESLTSIIIPNSVTCIGDKAFWGCSSLTSFTVPYSVISIGDNAFCYCSSIRSITIPKGIVNIGAQVFCGCSSLTSIVVESGNCIFDSRNNCNAIIETATNTLIAGCKNTIIPNSITCIGESAFYGCEFLSSITIPNSITSIETEAFSDCPSLTSIIVATGNRMYDSRNNCNAIIETSTNTLVAGCKSTIIPNSITCIGESAFSHCDSLTTITIPASVMNIGDSAFYCCDSLSSITIPNSVIYIGEFAFFGCSSLTSTTIPKSVKTIEKNAFCCCHSLISFTLSDSVMSIGEDAFEGCDKLEKIYIPLGHRDRFIKMDGLCNLEDIIEEIHDSCDSHVSNHQHKACTSCGKLFSSNFSFCPYCGVAQGKSCSCGAINIPLDAFFCPECGTKL